MTLVVGAVAHFQRGSSLLWESLEWIIIVVDDEANRIERQRNPSITSKFFAVRGSKSITFS
jgi:hypothetical protein